MDAASKASLSITNSWSSLKLTSIKSVMPSSHVLLCRPRLLLPPIPPSIRVFSKAQGQRSLVGCRLWGRKELAILKITFFTSPQACCWWCLSFLLLTAYLVTSQFYKVCIFGCVGLLLSSLLGWVSVQLTIRSFPFIAFAEGSLCWNILSVLWQTVYTFLPLDLCTAACAES